MMRSTAARYASEARSNNAVSPSRRLVGRALSLAALPALSFASPAGASTLLSVSGTGASGQVLQSGTAAAVSFGLDHEYINVSISADLDCVNCTGEVILMQNAIGPTATLADFVTAISFNATSPTTPVISGLDLAAGDYFLIFAITGNTGAGGWIGSDPATITTLPGVNHGLDLYASSLANLAYNSSFQAIVGTDSLQFSVVGDRAGEPPAVPEPTTWMLMVAGFGTAAFGLRRRGSRSIKSVRAR